MVYPYPVIDRVFDEELNQGNRMHCHDMIGLGQLGLRNAEQAQLHFDRVLGRMPIIKAQLFTACLRSVNEAKAKFLRSRGLSHSHTLQDSHL